MEEVTETDAPELDKFQAAGEALGDAMNDALDLSASTEETPGEQVDSNESLEAESEDPEKAEEEASKPEDWRWKRVREREAKADKAIAEASEKTQAAEKLREELVQLANGFSTNPVEAFSAFAERAGYSADQLFEIIGRNRIQEGVASPEMQRIRELEKKLADREAAKEEAQRKAQEEAQERQAEQFRATKIKQFVDAGVALKADPEKAAKYPHLTALSSEQLAGTVRYGVEWAMKNSPETSFSQLLNQLEGIKKKEHQALMKALGVGAQGSPSTTPRRRAEPETLGNTPPTGGPEPRTTMDMTQNERYEQIRRLKW